MEENTDDLRADNWRGLGLRGRRRRSSTLANWQSCLVVIYREAASPGHTAPCCPFAWPRIPPLPDGPGPHRNMDKTLFLFLSDSSPIIDWLPLSVTHSLTTWLLFSILESYDPACEDANSEQQNLLRLLLMLMLMLRIMLATVCYRFGSLRFVLKLNFCSDFEHKVGQDSEVEVQARFWSWSLFIILPLMFCRGYEVESWSRFWS